MKRLTLLAASAILLCLAGIGAGNKHRREVIILRGYEYTQSWNNGPGACGSGWTYGGIRLYNASSSDPAFVYRLPIQWQTAPCAPKDNPEPISLAEAVATALSAGYEIRSVDPYGQCFVLVR